MPSYTEIENVIIPQYRSFTHAHSMKGINTGTEYLIYSYSTLIARVLLPSGQVTINPEKYSSTTTRQQNLVKRALGVK